MLTKQYTFLDFVTNFTTIIITNSTSDKESMQSSQKY
jgi:hypothetical protein